MKRVAGWLAAALLLFAPAYGSKAEVTAEKQESRGRVTEIAWKDENGSLTAGPEGYAVVRYSYEYQKVTETYFDAEGFPYETAVSSLMIPLKGQMGRIHPRHTDRSSFVLPPRMHITRFALPNNIHIVCYCRKLQMFCQHTDLFFSCINHDTAASFPQRPSYSDRSTDSTVTGSGMGCSAACIRSPRMTAS